MSSRDRLQQASKQFQRARDIEAEHGFFSAECRSPPTSPSAEGATATAPLSPQPLPTPPQSSPPRRRMGGEGESARVGNPDLATTESFGLAGRAKAWASWR